ncbi:ArdC family protein [Sphingobacterium suaedae]|uniref:ArdC family protein n=1 Tax=Sphingobacterium suaedae TaxID=1686402 RepID=A0ABW5KMX0_9SPHI
MSRRAAIMAGKEKKTLYETVAASLIGQLEQGTAPWLKPWNEGKPAFELPYNALTGRRYKGINVFSLLSADRDDPRWVTFNQASNRGWKVRRGEKATLIQFVKVSERVPWRDDRGNPVLDEKGNTLKIEIPLNRPLVSNAWVFNATQLEGVDPLPDVYLGDQKWESLERAENLIAASGAEIMYRIGDQAYYDAGLDRIVMPSRKQFDSSDRYYATLMHELGHWTGHKDRLDRGVLNNFGSSAYAREELRAEIASMLLGHELNIGHDPGQHAAYIESWIKLLRDTPFEIHSAAVDAEKICKYILAFEPTREIKADAVLVTMDSKMKVEPESGSLLIGDRIDYNGTSYKILGHLKRGRLRVEDLTSGNILALSKADGLYGALSKEKLSSASRSSEISKNNNLEAAPKLRR